MEIAFPERSKLNSSSVEIMLRRRCFEKRGVSSCYAMVCYQSHSGDALSARYSKRTQRIVGGNEVILQTRYKNRDVT